jgi:electron transport complex protein RnfB
LQVHLDRMPVPFPATESGVEIRILQRLFTEQDARIALCLSAIPEALPAIQRRIRPAMPREALKAALESMAERGLIERHTTARAVKYGKSVFVIGIYERQVDRLTEDLERDILQYFDEAFGRAVHTSVTPQFRIVPVNRSVPIERQVARYDDIREFTRRSAGPFAVMHCLCRQGKDLVHEPCHQTNVRRNCLMFAEAAQAMVKQGPAHYISREEMLEFLAQADEEGLVLEVHNVENPIFVCCCCGCCCGVLTSAKKLPRPADYFRTNYYAEAEAARCEVCGACVPRCQMEAIQADDGPPRVDRTRCIGCGLCVTTCPSEAMRLVKKEAEVTPPKDMIALYGRMFRERYGAWGMARAAGRAVLGLKV